MPALHRRTRAALRLVVLGAAGAVALLGASGCSDYEYVGEQGFYTFALTAGTAPVEVAEDTAIYVVEQRIELPIREPTPEQMARLGQIPAGVTLPFARLPWIERHEIPIVVDYAITNLGDEEARVAVTLNGISEFTEYVPGVSIVDDALVADFASWERTLVLAPAGQVGSRRTGTIREEELDEVAVDLATVINGVTNANAIVHPDSQSAIDPRAIPFVPSVVPGLVGLRFGVRAETRADGATDPEPPPELVVELTVRVRDPKGLVVRPARAWALPAPAPFEPSSVLPVLP